MLQNLYKPLVSGLIVILLLAACAPAAPVQDDRVKALEDKVNSLADLQTKFTALQGDLDAVRSDQAGVSALQSKLDSVQSNLDELSKQIEMLDASSQIAMNEPTPVPEVSPENPFALSVTQFVLDSSGFHGMAEAISTTQQIDPAYLGTVNRAYKVLSQTTWPEPLAEQGLSFVTLLNDFSAAMEANDVEAAAELSEQVHDAQHELSHAIDDWEATAMASTSHSEDLFALSVAQFVMDSSGFHGMAEAISTTQQIDPAYLGTVNRAYKVLSQTAWTESLAEQGSSFVTILKDFIAALEANDVEAAAELSEQVHDAQHELSHAIDDFLGKAADAQMH